MRNYEAYVAAKRLEYGDRFDVSELDHRFAPLLGTSTRVRVKSRYGEIEAGRIGVTTGWKPAFLLMPTVRSTGSSRILGPDDQIIGVKYPGTKNYRALHPGESLVAVAR